MKSRWPPSEGRGRGRTKPNFRNSLAEPVVEQLPVDREVARIFGDLVAELRRRGTPMPSNDIWIVAARARAGATLLSFDAHFRGFPRIGVLILEP